MNFDKINLKMKESEFDSLRYHNQPVDFQIVESEYMKYLNDYLK